MSRSSRPSRQQSDPLAKWLALDWNRPERSYNPDVRDFLAGLLNYPKDRVVTEDAGGGGYPDIKLLTPEKIAWVVGDLKKDDAELNTEGGRRRLWNQKRKYIEGLTRYVLFLTARYLWIVLPTGVAVAGFENPCNLSEITFAELKERLKFISYEQATHSNQWATFIDGQLPYVYLKLDVPETLDRLRQDLQMSFAELCAAAEGAIASLIQQYEEFKQQEQEIQRNLVDTGDTQRRALVRLRFKFDFHRHLFEDLLPRFEDQYGRDVNARGRQVEERIRESFVADSVAVLVARMLFLRLVLEPTSTNSVQVIAGRSISVGWSGEPVGWVDLNTVRERPYGKLSLWADQTHEKFLAVAKFTLAPTISIVSSRNEPTFAAVDTVIVALPKPNGTSIEAVSAYLNSKLARFYWAVRLRSGVLEGSSRATFYPRTLEALPWVRTLDAGIEQQLVEGYNELARLAAIAKNNPDEWLLSEVETRIETSRYKLSDKVLGLNFTNWSTEYIYVEELKLDGNCIRAGLFSLELVDADVAELVYKLLTLNAEEETTISRAIIQKLLVPQDYAALMQDYRQRKASFQQVESDFFAVLNQIDNTVYAMFGLTDDEKSHIENRLASFPLHKLQPRYPWQTVKLRPIKAYTSDRFA